SVGLAGSALLEQRRALEIAGGILVVAMGLILLGRGVPMLLMRERRFHLARRPATLVGSGLAGVAFATGWTPCIGPTLAAALTIAANGGDPVLGASLLVVYALGLGLPFLLTGLFLQQATTALAVVRPRLPMISMAGAGVLVVFGVLLATGKMTELTTRLGSFGTPL
ncbi:MAG: cytochrome c biogenesis CcdA family protein, partial [Thermoleophilia bacterium]